MYSLLTIIPVIFVLFDYHHCQNLKKPVVSVYYGAYSSDSIRYYENQIYKEWKNLKKLIVLDLLPFGKADQKLLHGKWVFECQNLQSECFEMKLHACAIHQACGTTDTRHCEVNKMDKVIEYLYCSLTHSDDEHHAVKQCSKYAKLDGGKILNCAKGKQGSVFLSEIGKRTLKFSPEMDYLPTVAVNGVHDQDAEENLINKIKHLHKHKSE